MTRRLYDLALRDADVRPSPFCWVAKFALLHKGLRFETKAVGFVDKSQYPDPEYGKVPILVEDGEIIRESLGIVAWLEKKHPEQPLTKTDGERAAALFYSSWVTATLYPALAPLLVPKIWTVVADADRDYYQKTREERFARTFDEMAAATGLAEKATAAVSTLAPPLALHRFLGGGAPNLCDYIVFGPLMWQRSITEAELYETPKAVADWKERMLDLFDGYARSAKSAQAA